MTNAANIVLPEPFLFKKKCLELMNSIPESRGSVCFTLDRFGAELTTYSQGFEKGFDADYAEKFYQYDPLHYVNLERGHSLDVVSMKEYLSTNDLKNHPFYEMFMKKWGFEDCVVFFFRVSSQLVAGASFVPERGAPPLNNEVLKRARSLHSFIEFSIEQSLQAPRKVEFDRFCSEYLLTPKETMILEMLLKGLTNQELANSVGCQLSTVKSHLQSIFSKLGVNSKVEVFSMMYFDSPTSC